jgi:hypothetical protein
MDRIERLVLRVAIVAVIVLIAREFTRAPAAPVGGTSKGHFALR